MTPAAFMERARELDLAIQQQDRRLLIARARHVDTRLVARMVATRNDLAHQWGAAWRTKPVTP